MKLLVVICLATAAAAFDYKTAPGLYCDTWWGSDDDMQDDTSVVPYTIEWPQEDIDDLVYRLKNRRDFVPSLKNSSYNYGVNTHTIGYWLDYWANDYQFREREQYMNQYPHYRTKIQGIFIHFIWIQSEVPEGKTSVPVLLMHGFPGSVREFYEAIKYLTQLSSDTNYVFQFVIPSLPGFGYSECTEKIGLGAAEMACIFRNLMFRLGYLQFLIQGGDWGALIGANMATFFPNTILGYHTNMGMALTDSAFGMMTTASMYPAAVMPVDLISRLYPLKDTVQHALQQTGYFHMQATQPDTVGIAMSDSPSGVVAWIFQQISTCSRKANINDTRGGLDLYSPDELLDNVMVYWMTNKLPCAFRIYAETFNLRNYYMDYLNAPTPVPTVVVQAKYEIYYMPPPFLLTKFTNLIDVTPLDDYGHFLAWEQPKLFAKLVISGFVKIMEYREEHKDDFDSDYE